jgi:hypothetical protein
MIIVCFVVWRERYNLISGEQNKIIAILIEEDEE